MAGRSVGIVGEECCPPPVDVRQVDAGVGADEAVLGLADDQLAAAAEDTTRLALDNGLVAEWVGGIDLDHRALGLGDDLLGHDHHVVVLQIDGGPDDGREIVGATDLADALDGEDLESAHGCPFIERLRQRLVPVRRPPRAGT